MQDSDCDVLIIGAGAAGLAAACELADSGRQVLIIEARDRLGGRIWTRQEPGLAVPIEYGAEFIHGHASATMAVLQRAGKTAIESSDSHFRLKNGELVTRNDFFHDVLQAMRDNSALAGKDLSFDAFLAQCKSLSPESRQFARMMAEGFDAVDTSRASARAIVEEWTGDMLDEAAPHSRPQDGYAALLPALANSLQHENLHLQMQSIVREVRWSKGSVEVDGTFIGSPFSSRIS